MISRHVISGTSLWTQRMQQGSYSVEWSGAERASLSCISWAGTVPLPPSLFDDQAAVVTMHCKPVAS